MSLYNYYHDIARAVRRTYPGFGSPKMVYRILTVILSDPDTGAVLQVPDPDPESSFSCQAGALGYACT